MILNKNLSKVFELTNKFSDAANEQINHFWSSKPSFPDSAVHSLNNNTVSVQTTGYFNGEFGFWNIFYTLDDNQQIKFAKIDFSGENTSRKPYRNIHSLTVSEIKPNSPFWMKKQPLVNYTHARSYNYRNAEIDHPITTADVKMLSTPVMIANFSLTAKKDSSNNYVISANEHFGEHGYSCEISSEESEAIEA